MSIGSEVSGSTESKRISKPGCVLRLSVTHAVDTRQDQGPAKKKGADTRKRTDGNFEKSRQTDQDTEHNFHGRNHIELLFGYFTQGAIDMPVSQIVVGSRYGGGQVVPLTL
jgi:hypothetical protein